MKRSIYIYILDENISCFVTLFGGISMNINKIKLEHDNCVVVPESINCRRICYFNSGWQKKLQLWRFLYRQLEWDLVYAYKRMCLHV